MRLFHISVNIFTSSYSSCGIRNQSFLRILAEAATARNSPDERRGQQNLLPERSVGRGVASHGEQVRRPAGAPERVRAHGGFDGQQHPGILGERIERCERRLAQGRVERAGLLPKQLNSAWNTYLYSPEHSRGVHIVLVEHVSGDHLCNKIESCQ